MKKLITRVCWFNRGLAKFAAEVNAATAQGWKLEEVSIMNRRFRMVCYAKLSK